METSVNIDIFSKEVRIFQLINEEDHKHLETIWSSHDPELESFVRGTALDGAKRWGDISVLQYRFLIMQALEEITGLSPEKINEESDDLKRLRFFISAMIYKYSEITADHIEHIKIQHVGEFKVNFETISSQTIAIDAASGGQGGLRIVVDNTREEDDDDR